jgi:hypothetical protein
MRTTPGTADLLGADQRCREVAEILAASIVRLRLRAAIPGADDGADKPPDSVSNSLELPSETRLSVPRS